MCTASWSANGVYNMEGDKFPHIVEIYDTTDLDGPPLEQRWVETEEESQKAREELAQKHPGGYLVNVPPYNLN